MMMVSNGGGGGGGGDDRKGNVNGDHHRQKEEEDDEAFNRKFPAGYRFKPTDEELIKYYLRRKVNKLKLPPNQIKDINIYAFSPWDLSDRYRSYGDNVVYFFTPRERKYQNGIRPNRAASGGFWKANGIDAPIIEHGSTNKHIGYKRQLVFYRGKPPKLDNKTQILRENKTDWLMHEYTLTKLKDDEKEKRLSNKSGGPNHKQLNEFVLCKIYMKRGKSRKDMKNPDIAVDAAPSPSTFTTSAAVPEEHHQMHQTGFVAVDSAAAVVDHQYQLPSMVTAAATEEMVPENHHYMCQADVAAGNHQYSLTSMVLEAAAQEEMMPFDYNYSYLDNGNPSFSSASSSVFANHHYNGEMNLQQQLQSAILPSLNHYHTYGQMMNEQQLQSAMLPSVNQHYSSEMTQQPLQPAVIYGHQLNQQQLQPAVTYGHQLNQQQSQPALLSSVNQQYCSGEMTPQQLQDEFEWEMLVADWNYMESQSNLRRSAGFSVPDIRTNVSPK